MSSLIRRTAAVAGAIAALVLSSPPTQADAGVPGGLNRSDMTLLIGLHQSGLWEMPAEELAAQKGTDPKIRQAAKKIAAGHLQLDRQTVTAAEQFGATMPSTPTSEQQNKLNQLRAADGSQFDQLFVTSLRDAYGFLYPIVGEVRSATRSPVIRRLADQANVSLLGYMQTLESTGLVPYEKLAPAAIPPAQDLSTMGMAQADAGISSPISPAVLWLLAIGAAAIAAITAVRIHRGRRAAADPRAAARRVSQRPAPGPAAPGGGRSR
jgi:predicted outer membrane protein